ncbi:MAG TPA: hypothetical protein VJJ21_00900 [Candidatus Nanoarchaeia archaeon]|nr:hypothetical protein [Candidatus Nanoarchaeia archaeon]
MILYLATRPEHDDTTYYLSHWCKKTFLTAESHGIKVFDLHREKANREEFEGRMNKFSPNFVVLNGHGDVDKVGGHKNEILVSSGVNEDVLKGKIVYAISCKSANILGKTSVEKGALNYTGYDDDFIFFYEPKNMTKPLTDETAKLFLEHSQLFIESLLKGNSLKASKEKAENKLRENINKILSTESSDSELARFLVWDLNHFISHGDLDTSLGV